MIVGVATIAAAAAVVFRNSRREVRIERSVFIFD
jgi:hypothetical protein